MSFNYISANTHIVFNDGDPDLEPIHYELTKPIAKLSETVGYGLPPELQKWRRFEMPPKLKELNEDPALTPSQKVEVLEQNHTYYEEEIKYIQSDWDCILNGLTVFINGRQHYITGPAYLWLQHWRIEGKAVDFRYRDLKSWYFDLMVDEDEDCIGTNYPKHRREGCTNRQECKAYYIALTVPYAQCGMQSKDRSHAQEIHEQMLMPVWREHMPFWLKPIHNGQNMDTSVIRFSTPLARNNPDFGKKAMNSLIDFRDSGEKAYDGLKLRRLFNDEIGKTIEVDVKRRFEIQRQCLVEGSDIIGKVFNGSTVDEMDKGGGRNFKRIADQSHYHKKNEKTGRTTSWLYNFFQPASEGFDGKLPKHLRKGDANVNFIDEFGFDIINPETGLPAAYDFHIGMRASYELEGDIEGLIEYTRMFPLRWKDCWRTSVKDCNFNLAIIEDRLDYYSNGNTDKQRGNFEWENDVRDSKVIWVPDENGKFYISYQFDDPRDANSYYTDMGMRCPGNTRGFVAGGDPFKFKTSKTGKKSKGGGAVFRKHDPRIDPPEKERSQYQTNRFVCTYSNRPKDKKIYGEDMIMMCHYFGCQMNPEINVEFLWDYFEERGYGRYLYYSVDQRTQKISISPGATTHEKNKEQIFREYQYYIQHFGANERHDELLQECKDIEDDMRDFDLFVSGGYALMAVEKSKFVPEKQDKKDISELFPAFYYN